MPGWLANGQRKRSRLNLRFGQEEFSLIEVLVRGELSPEQIVGRRKREGVKGMSHETIYKWIWADKRRGGTLWKHLRGAQKRRRKRYRIYDSPGRLSGKTMIQQRPAVVTVVERKSGIVRIEKSHRATEGQTLGRTVSLLWDEKERVKTITADNGCEFHNYKELESILKTKVYFATPHHVWERGTNENTNGLIRQYLPKEMDLSRVTQDRCNRIAEKLNNHPRKRLDFRTPNEDCILRGLLALQS